MNIPGTRWRWILREIVSRIGFYGAILCGSAWWMFWMPGSASSGPLPPLRSDDQRLESQLRADVAVLAGAIGERNADRRAQQLEQAARFLEASFRSAGYQPESQWFDAGTARCRNLSVEIRGADRPAEIVVVGAHYDSAPSSPGADDNASGVAAMLALARTFAGKPLARTLRFVAFANEEPPYFGTDEMGSQVYAKRCHQRGEQVKAMLSIESVGYYSTLPASQHYPAGLGSLLGWLYPSTGDFVAFVGNLGSRSLVHEALGGFRNSRALPFAGAAVPNSIPGVGWSDHSSFWQQGYSAIEITDTALYRNPYYHTPGDTPRRLEYDRLARFTSGMNLTVEQITRPR